MTTNEFLTCGTVTVDLSDWSICHDNGETALLHNLCEQIDGWFDGGPLTELCQWVNDSVRSHTCPETETP